MYLTLEYATTKLLNLLLKRSLMQDKNQLEQIVKQILRKAYFISLSYLYVFWIAGTQSQVHDRVFP